MAITTETSQEPIPGYRILERIGAGGYGEVWKAEAPGGLVKALKFVYGRLEEDRAAREMKSLERIKDVRHPFLLSLERIEVADGRLIIVTELAEGSLKDRYDQCRSEGRGGIGREELLTYMRDAADVLDFMHERHSLQHLDIKPENLLLVGGRIKVADFGLVKKLQDVTASLLGGLTPLYAPPELFEGEPSSRSDQYSLAIVYLEMLTGSLPFAGRSAGQLAKQHLHAAPKLGALPATEQAAVRRALAKRPEDRFPSCREFVEALVASPESAQSNAAGVGGTSSDGGMVTEVQPARRVSRSLQHGSTPRTSRTEAGCVRKRVPRVIEGVCRDERPIEVPAQVPLLRPTIWIGLGGAGSRIVATLRDQLGSVLGINDEIPCWQTLFVDTDVNELSRIVGSASPGGTEIDRAIAMPLRRPQEYKEGAANPARWLSRRWLYHIPKVPATAGLRPLGCLAFTDHRGEFEERLGAVIEYARRTASLEASGEKTGFELSDGPVQVYLVAGIGGGTGGGMLVEVANAVNEVFVQFGCAGECRGVLIHASPRSPQERELAIVSSYAALTEIHHAQRAPEGVRPFVELRLQSLGDGLLPTEFESGLLSVAEQLTMEVTTAAGRFKYEAQAADADADTESSACMLRASGMHAIGARHGDLIERSAKRLAGQLVELWLTGETPEPVQEASIRERVTCTSVPTSSTRFGGALAPALVDWVAERCQEIQLEPADILTRIDSWCQSALSEPVADFIVQETARMQPEVASRAAWREWYSEVATLLTRLLGADDADADLSLSKDLGVLDPVLEKRRHEYVDESVGPLVAKVMQASVSPEFRVAGAHLLVQHFRQEVRQAADTMRNSLQQVEAHLKQHRESIDLLLADELPSKGRGKAKGSREESPLPKFQQWAALRWEQFRITHAIELFASVDSLLAEAYDELGNVSRELRLIHDSVDPPSIDDDGWPEEPFDVAACAEIAERASELVARLDDAVGTALEELGVEGSWVDLIRDGTSARTVLPECLLGQAAKLVQEIVAQCDIVAHAAPNDSNELGTHLQQWFELAGETAEQWGGVRRRFLMVPDPAQVGPWLEAYYAAENNLPSILKGLPAEVVLGVEVGQVPIARAAVSIIEARSDRVDYAYRLFTRSDIEYEPLPDESEP